MAQGSPDLEDKRGGKKRQRSMMVKTIGKCHHLTRSQAKAQAQAQAQAETRRERDISLVYGLDSLVVNKPGPKLQRHVTHVYGLDCPVFRCDKQEKQGTIRDFLTRKAAGLGTSRAMNDKGGRFFYTCFTCAFPKHREKIVLEAWPTLESSLKSLGISCSLNVDLVYNNYAKIKLRSITFSTTLSTRGGPDMIDKAMDLLEIIALTDAPPLLAIQILDGSLQYDIIRIVSTYGGFCSQLSLKNQEKRFDLVKSIGCSIKGSNAIALGNSKLLKLVRYVVRACFFSPVKPATMIRVLNYFRQDGGKLENAEMNILGFEPKKATLSGPLLNQDGMLVCGSFFSECRGKLLGKVWPIVQSTLKKYGISCRIYMDEGFMTISTNKSEDIILKARDILELLAKTVTVPSRALLVLTDGMKHDIIKIGYQNGGLGSKVKINKKQLTKQRQLIWACRQDLEKVTCCDIYINENTVAAIALEPERLSLVRNLVARCIVGMENPASMIEEIELEPEKKKVKVCHLQGL